MRVRIAVALLLTVTFARASEIRGKVTNVIGGEPLGRVQVSILDTDYQAVTSSDGTFTIKAVKTGKYTLRFTAVGYRLVTVPFSLGPDDIKELDVNLAPDNFRRTEAVVVTGDIFQGSDPAPVNEMNLTASEIKESSTVLADDPFRAIQSLPGVSAAGNNELFAEFSVAGAPFGNVGVYLDDVLIPGPFHTVPHLQNGASLSLLTSETIEEMKLLPAAYPEKFGDAVGAALDIRTRDGSRTRPLFRIAPGIADSEFLGEGGLGREGKGSWLTSFRKSYIGWLVRDRVGTDFSDLSFYDADLKLTYDVSPGQTLSLYSIGGHTNVKVAHPSQFDIDSGATDFYLTRLGWRASINPQFVVDSRAAYIREPLVETAFSNINHSSYQEWTAGTNVAWNWAKEQPLEAGITLRRLHDAYNNVPSGNVVGPVARGNYTAVRGGGYVQQSSSFLRDRVHLMGGMRFDALEGYPSHPFSPQASAAVRVAHATQLQLGYGRYTQFLFPPFTPTQVACGQAFCGQSEQAWQTANHYSVAIEQRFSENIRMRLEAFDRQIANVGNFGPCNCPPSFPAFPPGRQTLGNSYSRGLQLILQRRSANRLSGWIGYTLAYARQRSSGTSTNNVSYATPYFSTLEDQRHSLNAFATYRLKPTLNLSGKFLYGSGFPVFSSPFPVPGGSTERLPAYIRADVRTDKSWAFTRWKFTLYGEVLNVTNHYNRIFLYEQSTPSGQVSIVTQQALPITPTVGVAFEF